MSFAAFELEGLKLHNNYRAMHGVPLMTLNKQMCIYAQAWADELIADRKFCHRANCDYGENLFSKTSSDKKHQASAADAVDAWYSEIKAYQFNAETCNDKTGHFTQVIWKCSTQLGLGVASKEGRSVIVANYNPRGNMTSEFKANCPASVKHTS